MDRRRLPLPSLLAGLMLAGCGGCPAPRDAVDAGVDAGPGPLAEREPNDDREHAVELTSDCRVEGQLAVRAAGAPDVDWYRLALPSGRIATLRAEPAPGVDLALELWDADGVKRGSQDAAGPGGAEVLTDVATDRPLFVRVAGKKVAGPSAYLLRLESAVDDGQHALEPDGRAADATLLAFGSERLGHLSDPGDEDWFRLELAPLPALLPTVDTEAAPGEPVPPSPEPAATDGGLSDGGATDAGVPSPVDGGAQPAPSVAPRDEPRPELLHLSVKGVPGVRLEVAVLNAAQAPLHTVRGRGPGDGIDLRNLALRGPERTFYVVVRSAPIGNGKEARRAANAEAAYAIEAEVETATGASELEPNEDLAHATALGPNLALTGFLSPKGDVDVVRLSSDTPQLARVELSGVDHLDLELALLRPSPDGGRDLVELSANDGELKEPELLTGVAVGPGRDAWLRIQSAARKGPDGKWVRDGENPTVPWRLVASLSADDGSREREPNDRAPLAMPLVAGQPVRGVIHPAKDVDLFLLDLSEAAVKSSLQLSVTGLQKVDVKLRLFSLAADGTATLLDTADRATGDQPERLQHACEPGRYLVEVSDSKGRGSNFADAYRLEATVE